MFTKYRGVPKASVAICPSLNWAKDFFDSQSMLDPVFNGRNIVPTGNVNTAELDDPGINAALNKAASLTDLAARARAYGAIDRRLTANACVIPWVWNNTVVFASKDVSGVYSKFTESWDLTWSSLK